MVCRSAACVTKGAIGLIGLLMGLASPVACGGQRGFAENGGGYGACTQTIAWGGWNGTPECSGIAASVIRAEHRMCQTDADCALVGQNACTQRAVSVNAVQTYQAYPQPCTHPLAGACAPARPQCQQGCCGTTTTPPGTPPMGTTPAPAVPGYH